MSTAARTHSTTSTKFQGWSPARLYLVVAGGYLVVLGIIGFLYDRSFPTAAEAVGREGSEFIVGVFETNGWHNLAAVVFGVVALAFLKYPKKARLGALIVGVPNALVTVAFILWDPSSFWFASNAADNVVHALLGCGGILSALGSRS